eukprot:m.405344 g.405344  ORF g.405344 m.405344 type:complete len:1327 (+) comp20131_c0_seq20:135-4115(+)
MAAARTCSWLATLTLGFFVFVCGPSPPPPTFAARIENCLDSSSSAYTTFQCRVKQLHAELLDGNGGYIRPRGVQGSGRVPVAISASFPFFENFEDKSQILTLRANLRYMWLDHMLAWDTDTRYAEIERIQLTPFDDIWAPNIELIQSTGDEGGGFDNQIGAEPVTVYSDGIVEWQFQGTIHVLCGTDITDYPFDRPTCNMTFSPTNTQEINLIRASSFEAARTLLLSQDYCSPGFAGSFCEIVLDGCASSPCRHGAECVRNTNETAVLAGERGYSCNCTAGFEGLNCELDIDECAPEPCQNGATCENGLAAYQCICAPGFSGVNCTVNIDECAPEPCANNATCVDLINGFECECTDAYQGRLCEQDVDECLAGTHDCHPEASCNNTVGGFECTCNQGWQGDGRTCTDVDECTAGVAVTPCDAHATCNNTAGSYECTCNSGWVGDGVSCIDEDDCVGVDCNNGRCVQGPDGTSERYCVCTAGWTGTACNVPVDPCKASPCQHGETCTPGEGLNFTCACNELLWQGDTCNVAVDYCASSPCEAGGECTSRLGGFLCACPAGFGGERCEINVDGCAGEPCGSGGVCADLGVGAGMGPGYNCTCLAGFEVVEATDGGGRPTCADVSDCASGPCSNGAECVEGAPGTGEFSCVCGLGFNGTTCDQARNFCAALPCLHGGTCTNAEASPSLNSSFAFSCSCAAGFEGEQCEQVVNQCAAAAGGNPCLNGGACEPLVGGFRCVCAEGFELGEDGLCSVNTDDCASTPCGSQGTCTDLVANYSCACSVGFAGRNCSVNLDDCEAGVCLNGGSCVDGINTFSCECASGFNGEFCQGIDECASSPCQNGALCNDGDGSFECVCVAGYRGNVCEENIDECAIDPCVNGVCNDLVNAYECDCEPGWAGTNCDINIDECAVQPCSVGSTCEDLVNGFECRCPPGLEGPTCSDEINECLSEPCLNGATCVDGLAEFSCNCAPGYDGFTCENDINECDSGPCQNGAACRDLVADFACACVGPWTGKGCETSTLFSSILLDSGRKFRVRSIEVQAEMGQPDAETWNFAVTAATVEYTWTITLERYLQFYFNRIIGPFFINFLLALMVLLIPWKPTWTSEADYVGERLSGVAPVVEMTGMVPRLEFGIIAILTTIAISWTVSDVLPLTEDPTWIDTLANSVLILVRGGTCLHNKNPLLLLVPVDCLLNLEFSIEVVGSAFPSSCCSSVCVCLFVVGWFLVYLCWFVCFFWLFVFCRLVKRERWQFVATFFFNWFWLLLFASLFVACLVVCLFACCLVRSCCFCCFIPPCFVDCVDDHSDCYSCHDLRKHAEPWTDVGLVRISS